MRSIKYCIEVKYKNQKIFSQSQKRFLSSVKLLTALLLIGLYSCQSSSQAGKATKNFSLIDQEQNTATLMIPFDKVWKIYPKDIEIDQSHIKMMAQSQNNTGSATQSLFFGRTVAKDFYSYTQYIINNRHDVSLKAYINYLMRTAYGYVQNPQNLGMIKTKGNIKGQLLQYTIRNVVYFEFIYRVKNFFLRTAILTPASSYTNDEEFNLGKDYALDIIKGIRAKYMKNAKTK